MENYVEVPSRRGRLYCASPDRYSTPDLPSGYFRPRVARPHILRVSSAASETRPGRKIPKSTVKTFSVFDKLASSRDNAKRLFRFVSPHPTAPTDNLPALSRESTASISAHQSRIPSTASDGEMVLVDGMRTGHTRRSSVVGGPISGLVYRPSLAESVRTNSAASTRPTTSTGSPTNPTADDRPLAIGNGLSISIALAEPVLFLQGFEQSDLENRTTSMLRGSLCLRVTKSAKIKAITLTFRGRAETEWPEGIPPKKTEFRDVESIMNHTWPFFNAQFQTAEGHGADHVQQVKVPTTTTKELGAPGVTSSSVFGDFRRNSIATSGNFSMKESKQLSLQLAHSRSFGKGEAASGSTVAQKGFRTFTPGDYTYNFELPIDSRLPETINVDLGTVKYELEATVERAGAFRANLVGTKEVTLIRAPSEGSLETVEPIAISRNWEDQLHYDIVISGKSFPLGAQVPIAFKLTPLAKVQCHRIKVYVTENIQYYTSNKRVHRLEPTRKVQLFEKRADGPSLSAFPGSSVRITAGGGVAYDGREAAARGDESVPRDPTNLLGDLEGEHNVGPTEMEFNVQLPSCHTMDQKGTAYRIHFDTTYQHIQVHHWIKIVMRLSRPDAIDPTKRRHFEISIDSPFHILSCRATQANIALPAYTSPESTTLLTDHYECGCPGALRRRNSRSTTFPPTLSSLRTEDNASSSSSGDASDRPPPTAGLTIPQPAHIHDHSSSLSRNQPIGAYDPNSGSTRPIHLLRQPSFNPPAFEEEEPPPPLMTPPPNYDTVVSGDPRSGLADYFSRLADEVGEDEDVNPISPSRMGLPLTPGGRVNRSMEERRTWLPLGEHATAQ